MFWCCETVVSNVTQENGILKELLAFFLNYYYSFFLILFNFCYGYLQARCTLEMERLGGVGWGNCYLETFYVKSSSGIIKRRHLKIMKLKTFSGWNINQSSPGQVYSYRLYQIEEVEFINLET